MSEIVKLQPQALSEENALLGTLMMEHYRMNNISFLKPEHFYMPKNEIVFRAMVELHNEGQTPDIVKVRARLRDKNELEKIGGAFYLTQLGEHGYTPNPEFIAHVIFEKYAARQVIKKLTYTANRLYAANGFSFLDAAEDVTKYLTELVLHVTDRPGRQMDEIAQDFTNRMLKLITNNGGMVGIPCGIEPIDNFIRGFSDPSLYLFAARPAMGKSEFGLYAAYQMALRGYQVSFFSLEMSDTQLFQRLMSYHTRTPKDIYQFGNKSHLQAGNDLNIQTKHAIEEIKALPINLHDVGCIGLDAITQMCRNDIRKGSKCIIIDYLGLIDLPKGFSNRNEALGEISRTLKMKIAKELSTPVIALQQLSRAVEKRGGDMRPNLSDLRDSGSLEQDADVVAFLYRPEYYKFETDENGDSCIGLCEFIIKKNRHGATDTVKTHYDPSIGIFDNWSTAQAAEIINEINLPQTGNPNGWDEEAPF